VLAEIMGTRTYTVKSVGKRRRAISYRNTNVSLHTQTYEVFGGKTGFTTAAGYCLLIKAHVGGRTAYMAFLGAHEKLTRFGDFGRVASWMSSSAHDNGAPSRPVLSKSAP
jgi:D-alanyl-D-alanine endopeptidase (penicillin-binding protein 7)